MVDFNDRRLQASVARFGPAIEGYDGRLDAVSADIKQLEQWLVAKVNEPFLYEMSRDITACPDLDQQGGTSMLFGGESIEGEFESLVFEEHKGRWRLMYVSGSLQGHFAMESPSPVWTDEEVSERRPLIETKAETRVRVARKLPAFFEAVARQFAVDEEDFESATIPF